MPTIPPLQPAAPEKITAVEIRQLFQAVFERLDMIDAEFATIRDGLTSAAGQQLQSPSVSDGFADFVATILLVGVDDNGQPTYKAKGGQYMKFGVRIWPEVLPALGLDPAQLHPGPNPINLYVHALMGERGPRKVVSLA